MTREHLRNYRKIKDEHRQIEQRLQALESCPESEEEILQPLREFYRAKLADLAALQLRIEQAIEALDYTERKLVRLRYFDGLPWYRVAAKINYSEPQAKRIHSRALEKLKRV